MSEVKISSVGRGRGVGEKKSRLSAKGQRTFASNKKRCTTKSVKSQARDLRRLLQKKKESLPTEVAEEMEKRAARLEQQIRNNDKEEKRKRFIAKKKELYNKIRFHEAQKVRRRLKTTRRLLQQLLKQQREHLQQQQQQEISSFSSVSSTERELAAAIDQQKAALASHLNDLTYILQYPSDQPYIALFPSGGVVSEETRKKQEAVRLQIAQRILEERLGGSENATEDKDFTGGFILSAAEARQAAATGVATPASAEGKVDGPGKIKKNGNLQREGTAEIDFNKKDADITDETSENEGFSAAALFEAAPSLSDTEAQTERRPVKTCRNTRVPPHTTHHTSSSAVTSSMRPRRYFDFSGPRQGESRQSPAAGENRERAAPYSGRSTHGLTHGRKNAQFSAHPAASPANDRSSATQSAPMSSGKTRDQIGNYKTSRTRFTTLDEKSKKHYRHESGSQEERQPDSASRFRSSTSSSSSSPSATVSSSAPKRVGLSKSVAAGNHILFDSDSD